MSRKPALAGAAVYVAVTCLIGRRVLGSVGSAIASDPGDPVLNAAILSWNAMHVPWTDAWYQFPSFHPTPDALTLSEHLLGVSLIATPIFWTTGNAVAAYNIALLLSYPLCGIAMYALARHLTGSAPAAFLAGLAFAFAPYRASQLPHIQVLFVFWAPLALLALHRFADTAGPPSAEPSLRESNSSWGGLRGGAKTTPRSRRSWLAAFGLCWLMQAASNGYFLVYFSVVVGLWVLWFLVARRRWRDAGMVIAAMAVAVLPLVPILYRYLTAQRELGLSRNLGEIASFGADIAAPLCAPATLTFWGWLRLACDQEGELFAGASLITLCVAGWWLSQPGRRTGVEHERSAAPPRVRVAAVRVAIVIAGVYAAIAASTVVLGPWRVELGFIRASASAPDKPASIALALLLVALMLSGRFHRLVQHGSTASFYAIAALVCWMLSWGPFPRLFGADALYQAPFAWLLQIPGVGALRVPARFWMMAILCLTVLMAFAVAALLERVRPRLRGAVIALASGALLLDGWMTIRVAAVAPPVIAREPERGAAVLVLPAGEPERDIGVVYAAVLGGWRSINGFSGYEPGYYEALRTLAQTGGDVLPDPFLERGDVLVVRDGREYRLMRRERSTDTPRPAGRRLQIQGLDATCGSEEIRYAADASLETRWVCGPQTADHQIGVDLGSEHDVGVLVHALGPNGADFPRHLVVETSRDRATWETAWEGSPAARVLVAALAAPRETRVVLTFTPRPARYVRLRQIGRHERTWWSVAELEIWSGGP